MNYFYYAFPAFSGDLQAPLSSYRFQVLKHMNGADTVELDFVSTPAAAQALAMQFNLDPTWMIR